MNLNMPSAPTPPTPNIPSAPPKSWKPSLIYWLVATIILCTIGLLGLLGATYPTGAYIAMQVFCLLSGMVHLRMMYRSLDWPKPMRFLPEFLFSLGIGLSAAAGMVAFYVLWAKTSAWIYASACLLFPLPFVLYIAFEIIGPFLPAATRFGTIRWKKKCPMWICSICQKLSLSILSLPEP